MGVSGAGNDHYDPNDAGSGTAGSLGDYSITFDLNNGDTNGLLSGAVAVPSLPAGYAGNIGYDYGRPDGGDDVDLFKLVAPDNGWMTAATITTDDSGYCDTLVRAWLVNADGSLQLLGSNDDKDPVPTAGQGHATDSYLRIHVLRGQTILFGVADYKNDGYDPTNLTNRIAGDGGTYSLQLDFSNADLNGNIAHARTDINLGDTFAGVIGGDGFLDGNGQPGLVSVGSRDVDVFRFIPTQTGVLEIDTQGQPVRPARRLDLFRRLRDLVHAHAGHDVRGGRDHHPGLRRRWQSPGHVRRLRKRAQLRRSGQGERQQHVLRRNFSLGE